MSDTLKDCFDLLDEADGDPISKGFAQQLIMEGYRAGKKAELEKQKKELLTPEEWWALAPWLNVADAPCDSADVLTLNGDAISIAWLSNKGAWRSSSESLHIIDYPEKWLPLPKL